MPLVSQPINSLLNGVSQQPASLRHPSQCEAQVNCYSGLATGLQKRPPLEHISKLMTNPLPAEGYYFHTINRSDTAQYIVAIENGDLRVFDLAGTEKTVNYAEHRHYCQYQRGAVRNGVTLRIFVPPGVTTADFATTISGTATVLIQESTTGTGGWSTIRTDTVSTDASISITSGNYYRMRIDSYTSGTIDAWIDWADVSYLQSTDPKNDFRAITVQDYTFICNDSITTAMEYDDDRTNSEAVTATVQTFGDLPTPMPGAGLIYYITGDISNESDGYYVKVDSTNTVYEEYKQPGNIDGFTQESLPHTLVDNLDGTFTWANGAWDARTVGDTDTNQDPPFIGDTVKELFFFRNRLGWTAGENVALSRSGGATGGYFNFWRESVPVNLDTDAIHLQSPHERRSLFHAATSFNETMILFTDEAQFALNTDGTLTPSSVSLDVTTEFATDSTARPVAVGQNVYFPVDTGTFTGIREYYVEEDSASNDATNVTAHVGKYIPSTVTRLIGASNEDLLVLQTSGDTDSLFVYKFFWDGDTKAQSSWSKWEFDQDENILHIDFIGPTIYFISQRTSNGANDEIWLSKIELNDSAAETAIGVPVLLDRLESATGTYNATADKTYFTPSAVPRYTDQTGDQWVVVTGSGFTTPGESPTVTMASTHKVSQDETHYDGTGTNGTFAGGTGYAASDTITLDNGSLITVDAVSSGVVTQFTVTSVGAPIPANEHDGTVAIAASTTSGSGVGFTISPNTNNISNRSKILLVPDDYSAAACYFGMEYLQSYQFSEQFYRSGETGTADLIGRLQLRKMNVRFSNTGYFTVEVAPRGRTAATYLFSGNVLGQSELTLDNLAVSTGTFQFPIICRSSLVDITLKNSSWKPATFLGAEWIGLKSNQAVIP